MTSQGDPASISEGEHRPPLTVTPAPRSLAPGRNTTASPRGARAAGGSTSAPRIAVLRALQLGDMLCATPALRALRAAHRDAHITLVGLPWHRRLTARFSRYIDDVVALPGYPGLPEQEPCPSAIPAFLADMHARRFDLALQLHGAGTVTNPLTLTFGAHRNAGSYRRGEYCPDANTFLPWRDDEHEVLRMLHVLEAVHVPSQGTELELPVLADEVEEASTFTGVHGIVDGSYVCVHPGARVRDKCWPPEAFARVADGLSALGLCVVLTGSKEEADLTAAVLRHMRTPALDATSADLSLGGLAALLRRARLLVCNDTGVSHMAAALCVPSIVVFTRTNPARWAPLERARHRALVRPRVAEVLELAACMLAR